VKQLAINLRVHRFRIVTGTLRLCFRWRLLSLTWRLRLELLSVYEHDLEVIAIGGGVDLPAREVTMLLELVERRTEFLFDLRRVFVLGDIQDLAEIAVTLLEEARMRRGVKPDL
jgi:hypothetical protein